MTPEQQHAAMGHDRPRQPATTAVPFAYAFEQGARFAEQQAIACNLLLCSLDPVHWGQTRGCARELRRLWSDMSGALVEMAGAIRADLARQGGE